MTNKKKGFTLIELIIVIAIMAVLLTLIVPAWGYYLQNARIREQNLKAKSVFNAAQTVITDLEFAERHYLAIWDSGDSTTKAAALNHIYTPADGNTVGEWYYYWDGKEGYRCDDKCARYTVAGGSNVAKEKTLNDWNAKIGNSIKSIVDDGQVYKVYVKDYTVQSVVCARTENDNYLGAHPTTLSELRAGGKSKKDIQDIQHGHIKNADMKEFILP